MWNNGCKMIMIYVSLLYPYSLLFYICADRNSMLENFCNAYRYFHDVAHWGSGSIYMSQWTGLSWLNCRHCQALSHYLDQRWPNIHWTLHWNLNQNTFFLAKYVSLSSNRWKTIPEPIMTQFNDAYMWECVNQFDSWWLQTYFLPLWYFLLPTLVQFKTIKKTHIIALQKHVHIQ